MLQLAWSAAIAKLLTAAGVSDRLQRRQCLHGPSPASLLVLDLLDLMPFVAGCLVTLPMSCLARTCLQVAGAVESSRWLPWSYRLFLLGWAWWQYRQLRR